MAIENSEFERQLYFVLLPFRIINQQATVPNVLPKPEIADIPGG